MTTTRPPDGRSAGAGRAAACFHGGAFWEAVGDGFDDLGRRRRVVNADVLDAWFPPAPAALDALREALPWLARTSPPTHADGLTAALAADRGLPGACVLPGAGSSDLIFLAFREWLTPASRVLLPDPTYGEYAHVCESVVGCRVDRLRFDPFGGGAGEDRAAADLGRWGEALSGGDYDLAVLVNPDNPSGRHWLRAELEAALTRVPAGTRVWVDETYGRYAGPDASVERSAVGTANVTVCTSLSKAYALSGLRAAYLAASPATVGPLRRLTPPWAVGLPAQVAAVAAVGERAYYAGRWAETHALRSALAAAVRGACPGAEVREGVINSVLCRLPRGGPNAATLVRRCREAGVFLRDLGDSLAATGAGFDGRTVRIAVKDAETQARIAAILADAYAAGP